MKHFLNFFSISSFLCSNLYATHSYYTKISECCFDSKNMGIISTIFPLFTEASLVVQTV